MERTQQFHWRQRMCSLNAQPQIWPKQRLFSTQWYHIIIFNVPPCWCQVLLTQGSYICWKFCRWVGLLRDNFGDFFGFWRMTLHKDWEIGATGSCGEYINTIIFWWTGFWRSGKCRSQCFHNTVIHSLKWNLWRSFLQMGNLQFILICHFELLRLTWPTSMEQLEHHCKHRRFVCWIRNLQ